jgi:hypothetical protein
MADKNVKISTSKNIVMMKNPERDSDDQPEYIYVDLKKKNNYG